MKIMAKRTVSESTISTAKKAMKRAKKSRIGIERSDLLSSGAVPLNLACSGTTSGAYPKGAMILFVGASAAGKTVMALTAMAEATINPLFNDYRLVYDGPEGGALMDMGKFFSPKLEERLEMPDPSSTVEEFYYRIDDLLKEGKPFIGVLDSMDSLSSEDDNEKFQKQKKALRSSVKTSGSFGTSKAKSNSTNLRKVVSELPKTGSILIIIAQTRDKLGFGFEKHTRGGGHALRFYSSCEVWFSIRERMKKKVREKNRQTGIMASCQVKKNRITGKEWTVEVPIYWSTGVDDVGACVKYLISESRWKSNKEGTKVEAEDLTYNGSYEGLVRKIQEEGLENDLLGFVQETWSEVEEACRVERKSKYKDPDNGS